jgi:hypothetical protein
MSMDQHPHGSGYTGLFLFVVSLFHTILAWTLKDAQTILAMGASLMAMVSGFYGYRYFRKKLKEDK